MTENNPVTNITNNTHRVLRSSLSKSETPLQTFNSRPYKALLITTITAVVLLVTRLSIPLGLILLAFDLFIWFISKNNIFLEMYPMYFVLFDKEDPEYCQKADYAEVTEWSISGNRVTNDRLVITLKDGSFITYSLIDSAPVYKAFRKRMPDAEKALHQKQLMEKPFDDIKKSNKISSFFKRFK